MALVAFLILIGVFGLGIWIGRMSKESNSKGRKGGSR